jgi:hypothetical protein
MAVYSTNSIFHVNLDLDQKYDLLLRDLLHYSTILFTIHLLRTYMNYESLFNEQVLENILFFLIGVMVYYLVLEPLVVFKGINTNKSETSPE